MFGMIMDRMETGDPSFQVYQNLIQGWNEINFPNEGLIIIEEGGVYVGYQQLNVNFNIGVDWINPSYASNSMLDFGIGLGWEELRIYYQGV